MEANLNKIIDCKNRVEQNFTENDKQNVKEDEYDVQESGGCGLRILDTKTQEHNPKAEENFNQNDINPNTTVDDFEDTQDKEQSPEQKYRQDNEQQHIYINLPDHNQEVGEGGDQIRDETLNEKINNKDDKKQISSDKFDIEIATEERTQCEEQKHCDTNNQEDSQYVLVNQQNNEDAEQDDLLVDKLLSEKFTVNKTEKDDQNIKIKNQKNLQLSQRLYQSPYLEDTQEYDAEDEEEDEEVGITSGAVSNDVQENIPEHEQANFPEHEEDDGNSLYAIDFKINCQLPAQLFLKYTKARAEQYNLTGWIEEISEGRYKGHFEGSLTNVSKVPQILKEFHNFRSQIKRSSFGAVHKILELSCRNFEIKSILDTNL